MFSVCHALDWSSGAPVWRRTGLPGQGGPGDQDAKTMEALDVLLSVYNRAIRVAGREAQAAAGDPPPSRGRTRG